MREQGVCIVGVFGLGLALACGGEPPPAPSGPPLAGRDAGFEANEPPRIEQLRIDPREPVAGDELRAVVRAVDPDGDPIQLGYRWSLDGRRIPGDGARVKLERARKGQRVELVVTASDGDAESAPFRASAEVGNRRPELLGLRVEPSAEVVQGEPVIVHAEARDPDGDRIRLSYRWRVNGSDVDGDGPSLETTKLRRGDAIQVRVVASDGEERSAALDSAEVRVANAPPKIVSAPSGRMQDGVFRYKLEARDPDGDRGLRFRLLEGPDGMRVDPVLGEVVWEPRADQTGRHVVDVAVEDAHGGTSAQRFEVTVAEAAAQAPAAAADE